MTRFREPKRSLHLPKLRTAKVRPSGGRTWWAHSEFTRINNAPILLPKKIEDVRQLGAFVSHGHVGLRIPVRSHRGQAVGVGWRTPRRSVKY
jgi:hypothetical protein